MGRLRLVGSGDGDGRRHGWCDNWPDASSLVGQDGRSLECGWTFPKRYWVRRRVGVGGVRVRRRTIRVRTLEPTTGVHCGETMDRWSGHAKGGAGV